MKKRIHTLNIDDACDASFIEDVEKASGQKVSRCYQCGNCSASCAYTYVYDYPANQIMRLIQLGQKSAVLHSSSIWLCASCQACTTRCPCNIDVAKVMQSLRIMSREQETVSEKNIRVFFDEFMRSTRLFGRVFETGLLPVYNFLTGKPLNDMDLAPKVLAKGKLAFVPHRIPGQKHIEEIFARFEAHKRCENKCSDGPKAV
ncbi:MAG: 4Fe-4S dicluster domain-containing protein [Syntrophobacteraceae bacterium]